MALYSYFGAGFIWVTLGRKKENLYQNFKIYNVKGFAVYLD
jgi:3-methyladenine DNA glycosylase Tag